MRKVLELPAFRRLLAVSALNQVASGIGAVALALLVYRHTGSAIGASAFFLCAEFGPAFLSPLFVARLDQRSAREVLSLLYGSEAAIFLLLAWLVGHFSLVPILGLTLLDGSLAVAARVLVRSTWTATTAPVGLLREAGAAVNSAVSVAYMVGPALGGVIVAAGGTRASLFVNVGMFALMTITVLTATGLPHAVAERASTAGRLRDALRWTRAQPLVRRLLGLQAVAMFFFTLSIPVEVVLARHTLHAGAGGYGALLAFWGGGTIVGSGAYARWRGLSSRFLITLGTVQLGCGFLLMAVAPTLGIALAGAAIGGLGNGVQVVAMRNTLQEAVPPERMAVVLSINESMFQAVPGAGIVLGGGIAAIAGARIALALGAAGSFLVACLMWLRLRDVTKEASGVSPADGPEQEPILTRQPSRS